MPEFCTVPSCYAYGGYCRIEGHMKAAPKKESTPIAKKSAKKKKEDKEVKRIVSEIKKISNRCQLRSPVCTGFIQGADHTQKISPKNATNKKNIKGSCNACNLYKEQHPDWAKKNGHSVSRFDKKFLQQAV